MRQGYILKDLDPNMLYLDYDYDDGGFGDDLGGPASYDQSNDESEEEIKGL